MTAFLIPGKSWAIHSIECADTVKEQKQRKNAVLQCANQYAKKILILKYMKYHKETVKTSKYLT